MAFGMKFRTKRVQLLASRSVESAVAVFSKFSFDLVRENPRGLALQPFEKPGKGWQLAYFGSLGLLVVND